MAPYLTDKGEHPTLLKINNNVYIYIYINCIKTSKIINYTVIMYFLHKDAHTVTHTHTHREGHTEGT